MAVESGASTDERFYQSNPVTVAGRDPCDLMAAMSVGLTVGFFIFVSAYRAESEVCGLLDLASHDAGEERQAFPPSPRAVCLHFSARAFGKKAR
ncbi:MAG: hypothetical protein QOI53_3205 [Verrucomicrobiota bacterium]|nr:hypothetical protein [Verrucomicrobiota bacterium]